MRAIICDKCGIMWKDENSCKVDIRAITLSYGESYSDDKYVYDLCEDCRHGLFDYLDNKDNENND